MRPTIGYRLLFDQEIAMHRLAYLLLAAAAGLMLFGLVRGPTDPDRRQRLALPIRMCASLLVWAAALIFRFAASPGPQRVRAERIAAGMGCGTLGDLVMAEVLPTPHTVASGMLSFGIGHGFYIRAFTDAAGMQPLALAGGLCSGWGAALLGWRALVADPNETHAPLALQYAALAYALLLGAMAGIGAARAAVDPRESGVAVGAALFLLSDLILAGELFRKLYFPFIGDAIWLTYLTGQALIVYGGNNARTNP
jgi:hypothetical protein